MAGYSGTPLPKKLGLAPGQRLAFLSAPPTFAGALGPLPEGAAEVARGPVDLAVLFVRSGRALAAQLPRARDRLDADGALWVSWPKRASGIETDLTEDGIRAQALAAGLVDVKVCAVDDTWSGLKLVYRRADRDRVRRPSTPRRSAPLRSG